VLRPRIFEFYNLAGHLRPLAKFAPLMKLRGNKEVIETITLAKIGLLLFLGDDFVNKALPDSHRAAQRLSDRIDQQFFRINGEPNDEFMGEGQVNGLLKDLIAFEALLKTELGNLPITCCDQAMLGNLSWQRLLIGAHQGYPDFVVKQLAPLCLEEIDEAGKCIVYERPTASGFHILRSVEITIKQYLVKIPGFVMPSVTRQSWGTYINCLEDNGASKEVVGTLRFIKDNHRNPLMHPEDTLTVHDAVSLFSVSQSMTETLVGDMKARNLI
jgi:hypothetical protein